MKNKLNYPELVDDLESYIAEPNSEKPEIVYEIIKNIRYSIELNF